MVYDNRGKTIKPKISKEHYTVDVLLDVLQSYKRQIDRSGKEYPTVVISDISASIDYVLRNCERINPFCGSHGFILKAHVQRFCRIYKQEKESYNVTIDYCFLRVGAFCASTREQGSGEAERDRAPA